MDDDEDKRDESQLFSRLKPAIEECGKHLVFGATVDLQNSSELAWWGGEERNGEDG